MNVRLCLVALCLSLVAAPALALETPELTVGAGFHMLGQFDAAVDLPVVGLEYGTINIRDSAAYTATLSIPLQARQGGRIELRYSYQPTRLQFESGGQDTDLFDLDVHTGVVGFFMERAPAGSTVVPFGGIGLGATWYAPDADREGETLFTTTATVGVTKYVNEKLGLTMRADLLMPIDWSGGAMWIGPGGANISLAGTSYLAQIGLGAGLTYRFGR